MDDTKSIDLISETIDLAEDEKFPSCTDMLSIFDGTQSNYLHFFPEKLKPKNKIYS